MLLNVDRMARLLRSERVDAIVATSPENVTYASGYWALSQWIRRGPQTYVLLPAEGLRDACIVAASSLLDLIADQEIWISKIKRFGFFQVDRSSGPLDRVDARQAELYDLPDDGSAVDALVAAVKEAGLAESRIAIDEIGLLPGYWGAIESKLPSAQLVPGAELLARIRSVKTPEEISRLRTAAQIAERSIAAALREVREGVTERELAVAFNQHGIRENCYPVLDCIGFGTRSAMPNVQPSGARLRRGDVIRFDVGGRFKHYRADIARIAVFGEPRERVRSYQRALVAGVDAALEAAKPGVRASELFKTAVETVQRAGIPHYSRSHVGHGIGLDGYDPPLLAQSSAGVLEEGMVLCVETPYYELGWCGLQVENTVLVTSKGVQSMMTTDAHLIEVG
jgi:Xaa-Pro dipeptidase